MSQRDRRNEYSERNREPWRDQGQENNEDWARQVPHHREERPYSDYGWERGQSVLPEFRDPSVHLSREEQERVESRRWNQNPGRDRSRDMKPMQEPRKRGPFSGIGPKNYQRSDERIKEDVCERLTRHGQIDARHIEIDVQNGEVILQGIVDTRHMKRLAEISLDQIHGVKDVHNRLRVRERQEQFGSGRPGGGAGRVDEVGQSGVYPASGPLPHSNAETQGMASWGQGERGAEGYQDHGDSELPGNRTGNRK